jgi:hypothetical protein
MGRSHKEDAQAISEKDIQFFKIFKNLEFISTTSIIVDGIQANGYIVAFTSTPDPDRDPPYLKPVDMMAKDIYFDYNGLIWKLSLWSTAEYFTSNEILFEQLIESFKILD